MKKIVIILVLLFSISISGFAFNDEKLSSNEKQVKEKILKFFRVRNYKGALQYIKGVKPNSENETFNFKYWEGVLRFRNGEKEKALAIFNKCENLTFKLKLTDKEIKLSKVYFSKEKTLQYFEKYKEALRVLDVLRNLIVKANLPNKNRRLALVYFRKGLAYDSLVPKGENRIKREQLEEIALKNYKTTVYYDPKFHYAFIKIAVYYHKKRNYVEATKYYKKAADLEVKYKISWEIGRGGYVGGIGLLARTAKTIHKRKFYARKCISLAKKYFKTSEKFPSFGDVLENVAISYYYLGKYKKAIEAYTLAIKKWGGSSTPTWLHHNRALAYRKLGKIAEAEMDEEKAAEK